MYIYIYIHIYNLYMSIYIYNIYIYYVYKVVKLCQQTNDFHDNYSHSVDSISCVKKFCESKSLQSFFR